MVTKLSPKSPRSIIVQRATLNHNLKAAADVINRAYQKARFMEEGVQRTTSEALKASIEDPNQRLYFCVTETDEICGTALVLKISDVKAEISLFTVDAAYKHERMGAKFLNYVETETFKEFPEIILKVFPLYQENLIKYYQSLGYTLTRELEKRENLPGVRPECADLMFVFTMKKIAKLKSSL